MNQLQVIYSLGVMSLIFLEGGWKSDARSLKQFGLANTYIMHGCLWTLGSSCQAVRRSNLKDKRNVSVNQTYIGLYWLTKTEPTFNSF